jgi:cardiolipin-specific phospholipase
MNITLAKGSGEYCINHILAPNTQARMPLADRVADLRKDMPVIFVYGDHDWMDPIGGKQSIEAMKKAGNKNGRLYIIDNAGHHGEFSFPSLPPPLLIFCQQCTWTTFPQSMTFLFGNSIVKRTESYLLIQYRNCK